MHSDFLQAVQGLGLFEYYLSVGRHASATAVTYTINEELTNNMKADTILL